MTNIKKTKDSKKSCNLKALTKDLLDDTPELMRLGFGHTRLSKTARLMRSINMTDFFERPEVIRTLHFTAADALSGADELAGEGERLLHAIACRPLALPERKTPLFTSFDRLCNSPGKDAPGLDFCLGMTLAVSGNINVEGIIPNFSADLLLSPATSTARPLASLLSTGASLATITHVGEFLGDLLPEDRAKSIPAGDPVQPLVSLMPQNLQHDTDPYGDTPFKALAATISAGIANTGVALGRPSDIMHAAIRGGLAAFVPSEGVFSSRDGFVQNWRYSRWGFVAHEAAEAGTVASSAAMFEGVLPGNGGHEPWEMPGFRPNFLNVAEVEHWQEAVTNLEPDHPLRIAYCFGCEWEGASQGMRREMTNFLKTFLENTELPIDCIVELPELTTQAPEIDWVIAAEREVTLADYFSRNDAEVDLKRLKFMLNVAKNVRTGPWKRERYLELLEHSPEMLSPWTPRIMRKKLAQRLDSVDAALRDFDVLICFGGSPVLDAHKGAQVAVPLTPLMPLVSTRYSGAVVTAAQGRDALALLVAHHLDMERTSYFHPSTYVSSFCAIRTTEENELKELSPKELEQEALALEAYEEAQAKQKAKASENEQRSIEKHFSEMADISERMRQVLGVGSLDELDERNSAEDVFNEIPFEETPLSDPTAQVADMDPEDFFSELQKITEDFHKALTRGNIPDSPEAQERAERAFAALSEEDRAWLSTWFKGKEKDLLFLVHEPFARGSLPNDPKELSARWSNSDKAYFHSFAQYWLLRREGNLVCRFTDRLPPACRTFDVRESRILALLLEKNPQQAFAEISELIAKDPEEEAAREWLLGLAHQHVGEIEASIEHLQKAHELAPSRTVVDFPLAQALLKKLGPDHPDYIAAREVLAKSSPSGREVLMAQEGEMRRKANFEQNLQPELPVGVFSSSILLGGTKLTFPKARLLEALTENWGITFIDRTPEDPDLFSFRIGTLVGTAKLIRERFEDARLAEAVQNSQFSNGAENILIANTGRIDLRVTAGTTPLKEAAQLFAQIEDAILEVVPPLCVLMNGQLLPKQQMHDQIALIRQNEFPLFALVMVRICSVMGENFLSSYGMRSFGLPEIELDIEELPPSMILGKLVIHILKRMLDGVLTDESVVLRFGPDAEHLKQMTIRRAQGRNVAGEVLRISPDNGTEMMEDEALPQA